MDLDQMEYLNAGCGRVRYPNCINMDIVKNDVTFPDVVASVMSIPFPAERFKGVIFAHVFEHLKREEHKWALLEIRRVLKKDGLLYLECPDFETAMKFWLENKRGRRDYWYQCIYGRDAYESDTHKSGVTQQYLTDILFEMGFCSLRWIDVDPEEALLSVIAKKSESMPEVRI